MIPRYRRVRVPDFAPGSSMLDRSQAPLRAICANATCFRSSEILSAGTDDERHELHELCVYIRR